MPAVLTSAATEMGGKILTSSTSYGAYGRLQGNMHQKIGARPVVVGYGYNGYGFASQVFSSLATQGNHWSAASADALGRVTQETIGNTITRTRGFNPYTAWLTSISAGSIQSDIYTHDSVGNLLTRNQLNGSGSTNETLGYDNLNRLQASTVTGQTGKSYSYDAIGNFTSKAGNSYAYNASCGGNPCPHAVATVGGIAGSFSYDKNGNLLSGDSMTIGWSVGNQPTSITKGGNSDTFSYGPERQRFSHTQSGAVSKTILYAGAIEEETSGSTVTTKTYLPSGLGVISDDGTNQVLRYVYQDNLGSTIAITDASGVVQERLSYDPWGKRRNLNGSDDSNNSISGQNDKYGYTGEEELDQIRLIHLNGRIYHPAIGRFTSADPTVPNPADQQAFNRFSYAFNNPFGYVDPSGHAPISLQRKADAIPREGCPAGSRICNILAGHGWDTVFDAHGGGVVFSLGGIGLEPPVNERRNQTTYSLPSSYWDRMLAYITIEDGQAYDNQSIEKPATPAQQEAIEREAAKNGLRGVALGNIEITKTRLKWSEGAGCDVSVPLRLRGALAQLRSKYGN